MKIEIRPLAGEDLEDFFALCSSELVAKFMRFDAVSGREEAQALLAEYLKADSFAIELDGAFGGVFSLKAEGGGSYGLSVFLGEAYWGKGCFTQILEDRMAYAEKVLHAKTLSAHVVGENMGSRRVLEKLGFSTAQVLEPDDCPGGLYVYKKTIGAVAREAL